MEKELNKLIKAFGLKGMKKEAEQLNKLVKNSGSIPAGMHRFILERGQFGSSSYDGLDYSESEDEEQEKQETEQPPA